MLEIKNVKKIYKTKAGETAALDDFSVNMPNNGLVFVTGRSGSGKTTLLNVVGALDGIDSGDIIIDGKKFSEFTPAEFCDYRNTCVGFVFQEYNLLPDYTVEKNIRIANELQGKETTKEEIDKILKIVDLEGLNDRKPNQLSGGQKQRVAIARALVKHPKIIMADEPTGALDQTTGYQVMETLKKLSKTNLVMVVSHDLEMAEKFADRILRLVDGKLVEDVVLTDTKIETNVIDGEEGLTVKNGSQLNTEETATLVKAIRERRSISFTDDISIRQREKTPSIRAIHPKNPEPFVSSKMKLKSSMGLGVNSLKVKPFRLIITIILSVFAFALFGIFDTMGSYNDAKVLANLLRSGDYQSVTASAEFAVDGRSSSIRLSQSQINDINRRTGYKFRGLYELKDNDVSGITTDYYIGGVNIDGTYAPGSEYYLTKVSDFVEFKKNEISASGIIDRNGFNVKLVAGEYPTLPDNNNNLSVSDISKIAISTYMADSIMHWIEEGEIFSGLPSDVYNYDDFVGKTITLADSDTLYEITGVINCGPIPQKYASLKDSVPNNDTDALASDLITYLHSGLHLKVFVADGYVNAWQKITNRTPRYTTNSGHRDFWIELSNKTKVNLHRTSENYDVSFYKDTDNKDNIVFFDSARSTTLAKNEVIISVEDFSRFYQSEENKIYSSSHRTSWDESIADIKTASSAEYAKNPLKNLQIILNSVYASQLNEGENYNLEKVVTLKVKDDYTNQTTEKSIKIVGFHFNINKDVGKFNDCSYPLMLSGSLMNDLGICSTQGDYARIIAPINSGFFSSEALGNYFGVKNGLKLSWYENSVLDLIDDNRETFQQVSNLFLIFSLVLAVFSIFMLFNYITTSIVARRQSIGILRALGSNSRDIFRIFITESLIIAIINGVLACFVSAIGCLLVNMYTKVLMGLTISFAIYTLRQIIITIVASIVTAVLASLIPIVNICKEKPVDLIRKA